MKQKKGKGKKEPTDAQIDRRRCEAAHRSIGTLSMTLIDWVEDLRRFKAYGWEIENREMVLESLRESRQAVDSIMKVLR